MKIGAVIAEYNPFHNGHTYQLEKFRNECALDYVAVIMSGCFVQRGEPALCDKYTRAAWALKGGADIVIELPVRFSLSNAQGFARGGVGIAGTFCDFLGFGAETDDISLLKKAASIDVTDIKNTAEGKSYPRAVYEWVKENYDEQTAQIYESPNSTLALEYIRAANELFPDTAFHVTKRCGAAHDSTDAQSGFASASLIREMTAKNEDISAFVPPYVKPGKTVTLSDMDKLILYHIRNMPASALENTADVTEGLQNLIKKCADKVTSTEQLLFAVKSKRITMARLKRILLCALLSVTQEIAAIPPAVIHVLGVREDAKSVLLPEIERRSSLKMICRGKDYKKYAESSRSVTNTDLFATNTYALFCDSLPNNDLSDKLLII